MRLEVQIITDFKRKYYQKNKSQWLPRKNYKALPKDKTPIAFQRYLKISLQNIQFEEIDGTSKSEKAGMLKLSDQGFKTTVITTLRVLVDKVDSMQEQMGTVRRETESLRNQKKKKYYNRSEGCLRWLHQHWTWLMKESTSLRMSQ